MNTYLTTQGDTWDSIAYRLWGEERLMDTLLACNPDHADVLIFPAGIHLTLPSALATRTKKTELPPWM